MKSFSPLKYFSLGAGTFFTVYPWLLPEVWRFSQSWWCFWGAGLTSLDISSQNALHPMVSAGGSVCFHGCRPLLAEAF